MTGGGPTDRVAVRIDSGDWDSLDDPERRCRAAVCAALHQASRPVRPVTVAVLLADDATLASLNRRFRHLDRPTNVLAFPADPADWPDEAAPPAGDIAIAWERLCAEARTQGKRRTDRLAHLVVHGTLHLCGHDHQTDADARQMEGLERRALASLGIADPYVLPEHVLPEQPAGGRAGGRA